MTSGAPGKGDPCWPRGDLDAVVDTSAVVTGDDPPGGDLCPGQVFEGLVKAGLVSRAGPTIPDRGLAPRTLAHRGRPLDPGCHL